MNAQQTQTEFKQCGLAPVVVLEHAEDAVPLAKALLAGGIWIMEITLRTDAALEAIERVSKEVPDILVGAGTVINKDLARKALQAGAAFLVSPGFSKEVADIAQENDILYVPGVATLTEVMYAVNCGYTLLKIFPADTLGGIDYIREIHSVFPKLSFMPSGGISLETMETYLDAPYISAVSGSWMAPKKLIAQKKFDEITAVCKETVSRLHGFNLLHIGINNKSEKEAKAAADSLGSLLDLPVTDRGTAYFVGEMADVIKYELPGSHGHIAIQVNDMERAMRYFKNKGYRFTDLGLGKDDQGKIVAIWFDPEQVNINGFAVHLRRK